MHVDENSARHAASSILSSPWLDVSEAQPLSQSQRDANKNKLLSTAAWARKCSSNLHQAIGSCHSVSKLRDHSLVGSHVDVSMFLSSGWEFDETTTQSTSNATNTTNTEEETRILSPPSGFGSSKMKVVRQNGFLSQAYDKWLCC